MKHRPLSLLILFLAMFVVLDSPVVQGQSGDPSDKFLKAYLAAQAGEKLERSGNLQGAREKLRSAASLLDELNQNSPDWQPLVVRYRTRKVSESLARVEAALGPDAVKDTPELPSYNPAVEGPLPTDDGRGALAPSLSVSPGFGATTGDVLDMATREVRAKIRQLEFELNTSRREADSLRQEKTQLARQLQATDAELRDVKREVDKSKMREAEIRVELRQMKEALTQAITENTGTEPLREQIDALKQELADVQAERDIAEEENDDLALRVATANHSITAITSERDSMQAERDKVTAELAEAMELREADKELLAENKELLEKVSAAEQQIIALKKGGESPELITLREQFSDLRSQLDLAQQQSLAQQSSIAELQAKLNTASQELAEARKQGSDSAETRRVAEENEMLREIVQRELREQARRDQAKKLVLEELTNLEVQSEVLMTQLDFLAEPVFKLSEEELSLLKATETSVSSDIAPADVELSAAVTKPTDPADAGEDMTPLVSTAPTPSVPPKLEPIAREARENFQRGQYKEAEVLYEKILAEAPDNVYALSNLGVVRFRSGRLKAAELAFKKAIAIAPEDSFSHSTLGIVYYRQGKFDEAIDVLTTAIALNPKNAIAHNYLGITASQKGWQEAAEKELHAAISLNPNYADAHFNLAVIYAVSQPPSKEIARVHYKKAVELGAEEDSTLEKLIN